MPEAQQSLDGSGMIMDRVARFSLTCLPGPPNIYGNTLSTQDEISEGILEYCGGM